MNNEQILKQIKNVKNLDKDFDLIAKQVLYYDNYKIIDNKESITFIKTQPTIKKSVYVMKDKFNRIKIGVSEYPNSRKYQLSTTTALDINVKYYTELCSNYFQIERTMHDIFKDYNIGGEWFDINENEAISVLKNQQFKFDDYIITNESVTYTYEEIERMILVYDFIDIEELEADNRLILKATRNEFIERIKMLFNSDNENNSFHGIILSKYVHLQEYLYAYFNIFGQSKLNIFNINIEYKPENSYMFMISNEYGAYDDLETYVDLVRMGIYKELMNVGDK